MAQSPGSFLQDQALGDQAPAKLQGIYIFYFKKSLQFFNYTQLLERLYSLRRGIYVRVADVPTTSTTQEKEEKKK